MTAVVLGKPNAETLSVAEFTELLEAMLDADYVTLSQLEAGIDELTQSDLMCESRADKRGTLAKRSRLEALSNEFEPIRFNTVGDVISHHKLYPTFQINFNIALYDWTKVEGDYGYKLVLEPNHPLRLLQEVIIDAAKEGNELTWKNAPLAEVMYFAIGQFGLYIDVQPFLPNMHETIPNQPRYGPIKTILTRVFGVEPKIYTMKES